MERFWLPHEASGLAAPVLESIDLLKNFNFVTKDFFGRITERIEMSPFVCDDILQNIWLGGPGVRG